MPHFNSSRFMWYILRISEWLTPTHFSSLVIIMLNLINPNGLNCLISTFIIVSMYKFDWFAALERYFTHLTWIVPKMKRVDFITYPKKVAIIVCSNDKTIGVNDEFDCLNSFARENSSFVFTMHTVATALELEVILNTSDANIFHFVGHSSSGVMAIGDKTLLSHLSLAARLKDSFVELILFNACSTAVEMGELSRNSDIITIGTTAMISKEQAISFSLSFYYKLGTPNQVTGAYRSLKETVDQLATSLNSADKAAFVEQWPVIRKVDPDHSYLKLIPSSLKSDHAKVQLYWQILNRAIQPNIFCTFTFKGKISKKVLQACGIQYELNSIWEAGGLSDLIEFKNLAHARPRVITGVSEERDASYFLNYYRAISNHIYGPCLFAVTDGLVYYYDKKTWLPYRSARDIMVYSKDPAPWEGFED